ncbi:MAG: hypothetical protein QOI28_696, partial [Mycobacterium sp.]|nr:hypothetical protein [Mycobacterium sp.]
MGSDLVRRDIFEPEHDDFRATARSFYETVCVPHTEEWEHRGYVDREAWIEAGKLGLIGWELPENYGGSGIKDFRFNAIMTEEFHATGAVGIGLGVQNDIVAGYMDNLATDEQQARWLPGYITGELISAIAMSEPGAGSDLANIATSA